MAENTIEVIGRKTNYKEEIPDGNYAGIITGIQVSKKKFTYLQFSIELIEYKRILHANFPYGEEINDHSMLGKLISKFTMSNIEDGAKYDLQKTFLKRECRFNIKTENKDGKNFIQVDRDSIKPVLK